MAQEHLLEIIDGMEMDLDQQQYADFKALATVLLPCRLGGRPAGGRDIRLHDRKTLKYAHDLGIAFQLTNIIRDVGEDARRGRIYLPQDELAKFGVHTRDILNGNETEGFHQLMQFQIERAQQFYLQAFEQLPEVDRKSQRTGLIMAAIYRATLDEVVASGCQCLKSASR